MPRNHNPGTLRNRNRITHKSRLKVVRGDIDADPLVLEEDQEKARVISTAGVDAEDANEHHLQIVLSAASHRHHPSDLSSKPGGPQKQDRQPEAYIPIPDSTGVVLDADRFYPSDQWKDPSNYVRASDTVDEGIDASIIDGFTFYMDERDQEWLEKNNEEARGEGTSAQGAVSTSGLTRSRSAKAKGKEPEVVQPVAMTEDEFELVMGIFEKVTHDKTEHLHLGLETGMSFPTFTPDYENVFSNKLSPSLFASFTVPQWIPTANQLVKLARVVYPYWRERRLERGGRRIIPVLNYDEADVKNESYICFRRREAKTVRKTRASQVSYSEKLLRLRDEMVVAFDMGNLVLQREALKKEAAQHAQAVWEQRQGLADLKRKHRELGVPKDDEEIFFDKERVKKPKINIGIPRNPPSRQEPAPSSAPSEPVIKHADRVAAINAAVEKELGRIKERDASWDDCTDNPYQPRPTPWPEKMFKFVNKTPASMEQRSPRAIRMRRGRGGRVHIDRHRPSVSMPRPGSSNLEEDDTTRRLREQWMFDEDDGPAVGPAGIEEQDRVLVDDFATKYLVHMMGLLKESDHQALSTDSTFYLTEYTEAGRKPRLFMPRAIQLNQALVKAGLRSAGMGPPAPVAGTAVANVSATSGTNGAPNVPVARPMQSAVLARISGNGGMRLSPLNVNGAITAGVNVQGSPTHSTLGAPTSGLQSPTKSPVNGHVPVVNGTQPEVETAITFAPDVSPLSLPVTPVRPLSQNKQQHMMMPNGYHLATVNGYPAQMANAYLAHQPHPGLPGHPIQDIKVAYATTPDLAMGRPAYPAHVANGGANFNVSLGAAPFNLKLPVTRQVQQGQWPPGATMHNGPMAPHPGVPSAMAGLSPPNRVPSANGMRAVTAQMMAGTAGRVSPAQSAQLAAQFAATHSLSPHLHAASPMPHVSPRMGQASPPRLGTSPIPPSPSMQPQQAMQPLIPNGTSGY